MEGVNTGFKNFVSYVHQSVKVPDGFTLIVNTTLLASKILELSEDLAPHAIILKGLFTPVKKATELLEGISTIDGIVNTSGHTWKSVTVAVSGVALFTFSAMEFATKFGWEKMEMIEQFFGKVPVFGVLPFAGLISLSKIGLNIGLLAIGFDERKKLAAQKAKFKAKVATWEGPITRELVERKLYSARRKHRECQENIALYEQTIKLGVNVDASNKKLNELRAKKGVLEEKMNGWNYAYDNFYNRNVQAVNFDRLKAAKVAKWEKRKEAVQLKEHVNNIGIAKRIISTVSTVVCAGLEVSIVGAAAAQYVSLGSALVESSLTLSAYAIKGCISKDSGEPVYASSYIGAVSAAAA